MPRLDGSPARSWPASCTASSPPMSLTGITMEIVTILTEHPTEVAVRLGLLFSYFTILSNVLLCVTSILLLIDPQRDGPIFRIARLDAVACITITGIVYNTVLTGLRELTQAGAISNFFLHQAGPLLAVIAWLLVGPRPRLALSTVAWSAIAPLAWIVYTFIAGAISGFYPYPFMNVTTIGYPSALLGTGVVVLIFIAYAFVLLWLDRVLPVAPALTR